MDDESGERLRISDPHVAVLWDRVTEMKRKQDELENRLDTLHDNATRATGGIAVLAALGTIGAFMASMGDKVWRWFH